MAVILTCSGVSNTGKLTTQVAIELMRQLGEDNEWVKARDNQVVIDQAISADDRLIVIEGCTDHCALKKLKENGRIPDVHVVATEIGIPKRGMTDPEYKEINFVVCTVKERIRNEMA